jgi:broad specificity phosphatase PhoE
MGTIYLIRHGQASFDADDYDQLSALGEEQSRLLGGWMRDTAQANSQVVLGSAKRHWQTAVQCMNSYRHEENILPPAEWLVDKGFDEFDHEEVLLKHCMEFHDFATLKKFVAAQDHPRRSFQALFSAALNRWTSGEFDDYTESWQQFQERCVGAMKRVLAENIDANMGKQDTWIFTSGGTISAIVKDMLAIPDARIFELNSSLINTGVTKILCRSERISLTYLNSPAHLEVHKRPELISYR